MNATVVGVSDCRWCSDPDGSLVTYALGSCVAVALHDPKSKAGAMLHFMLPESALDAAKAHTNPYMFGDAGIERLLADAAARGVNLKRVAVHLAGGAQILNGEGMFQIGKRNYLAAKKSLWRAGVLIAGEAVGGGVSRTVRLEMATGRFLVREASGPEVEVLGNGKEPRWRSAS